jgi:hypothetical protein
MINNLQKIGGIAALIEGFVYIVGFAVMLTLLAPDHAADLNSVEKLAFLLERQNIFQALHFLIYVVFGVFLVVLTVALHERLKVGASVLVQIGSAFGLVWAGLVIASGMVANIGLQAVADIYAKDPTLATSVWLAVSTVQNGLGGGVELVGGLWVLLLSFAALRSKALPVALNYIGLLVGLAGILTVIPGLSDLGAIFGLGQIVWFLWLGSFMWRNSHI